MGYKMNGVCYKDLKKFYDENKGEVYKYQDFENAGKDEVDLIFASNDLTTMDKVKNARILLSLVDIIILEESNISKVVPLLKEYPLVKYYGEFVELLKVRIESELFNKEDIIRLGRLMAFEGEYEEEVKLGLTLLNFDNIEEIKENLFVLGLYNGYAFYISKLLVVLKDSDYILFELAKRTKSLGRVIYTNSLDMLDKNIKEWLVCDGWKDDNYNVLLWNTTIIKVGYDFFLYDKNINEKTFKGFGDVLNNIFIYYDYEKISIFNKLIKRYIDLFMIYPKDAKSYLTLGNVYRYVVENFSIDDEYYKKVQKDYLKVDWLKVFNDVIEDESIDSTLLFQLAVEMEEDLSIEELNVLLKREPRDFVWYKYIEMINETPYSNFLVDFIKNNLNLEYIFTGPKDLLKEISIEDGSDHSLILMTLEALTMESAIYNQDFLLDCLNADLIDIRILAIEKLWSIKDKWVQSTKLGIKEAIHNEVVDYIKKKLIFLLYENNNSFIVTDINDPEDIIEDEDIYLTKIVISSATVNKLLYIKDLIKEGDVVALLNGLDGYKVDRIFIATNFGLVIGELSSREGEVIKNLILAGERIVGKIDKYDENMDFIYISLYKKADYLMKELSDIINEQFKFLIED